MFEIGKTALHVPAESATGRKRRVDALNWATLVRDKCHKSERDEQAMRDLVGLSGRASQNGSATS